MYTDKEILTNACRFIKISKVDTDNSEAHCFFTQQLNEKCMDKDEQLLCEGALSSEECLDALKNMNSDKSLSLQSLLE